MTQPLVSICIPAFGRPSELRIAIESIVSQDFQDLEVVVSDDSGDLETVVRAIGDDRIRYRRNPVRLGMAGNWNAALDSARGQIIGLLMDDDWLLPGFVTAVASRLAADPRLGMVFTNHYFQYGNRLYERRCTLREGRYDDFLSVLLNHQPVAVSAALMRREVWRQVRPLPDLLTADLVMQVRAAQAGWPFHYVAKPLMAYRVHPGQLSSMESRFRDDGVRAWEIFDFANPIREELRRRQLARALASRAATYLKQSKPEQADSDLTRAAALDAGCLGPKERAMRYLARRPALTPLALAIWHRSTGMRRLLRRNRFPSNWASTAQTVPSMASLVTRDSA